MSSFLRVRIFNRSWRWQVLIGCDGVHSAVARWLGLSTPIDSGRGAVRGLSVYQDGHGFGSEIHQFLGKNERGAFVPMNDKEIYWFITRRSNPSGEILVPRFL